MRLLVVDDDVELRDLLSRALERDGHIVTVAATVDTARDVLSGQPIDLMVLDLALPDGSGIEWCRQLRAERNMVAVLMLTAHSEVATRVGSLNAGADDFLGKPFAIAELRARVRALGRRRASSASAPAIVRADLTLEFSERRAVRAGKIVELTAREWIVLEMLSSRAGHVISRADLLNEGWGEMSEAHAASLEVLVGRIRRKLGSTIIRTIRGEGYSLEVP